MEQRPYKTEHITLDLGPTTIIMLAEILLVALKLMGHITYSWTLVLSPILVVIVGATAILLATFFRLLKNYLF